MNSNYESESEKEQQIDLLGLFFKYLSYWKLFLVSLVVCIMIAVAYLKLSTPIYEVLSTVLLKDDKKGGGMDELGALKDIGLLDVKNNVDNELEVLKTSNLSEQAIRELGIYVNYEEIGTFRNKILYGQNIPIKIHLPDAVLDTLNQPIEFNVDINPHGVYEFSGTFEDKDFKVKAASKDSFVILPCGKIFFKSKGLDLKETMSLDINILSPVKRADSFLSRMTMDLTSKTTSVVNIVLKTSNVVRGKDFLNKLVEVYNREDMKDQNLVASNTDAFVEKRLDSLSRELKEVEKQVENYKQHQGLTDIQSEAGLFIQKTGAYEEKRLEVETQLAIVTDVDNYIHKKENRYKLLPSGTGIQSENLNTMINDYNKLLLERNRLSRTASHTNQTLLDLNAQIDGMFSAVQATVRNEKQSLQIARQDLVKKDNENAGRIKSIPRQEREYTEIKRQQTVKETLYIFLLQKKEENFLTMVGVVPNAKIIDEPRSNGIPVSPNKIIIMLFSLLLGFVIPIIGLNMNDLLRYHIQNKEELEKISIVPILGEIAKSEQTGNIIIRENSTNRFTEMFRLLRTNLLFVLGDPGQKVINVISSIGGEGKSFMCINLAMSLALLDKKILIIGLDVRKPKLGD